MGAGYAKTPEVVTSYARGSQMAWSDSKSSSGGPIRSGGRPCLTVDSVPWYGR